MDIQRDEIAERLIKKIRFAARYSISNEMLLHSLDFTVYEDQILRQMIYSVRGYILGTNDVAIVRVPKNWWQMFKYEHFPKWLLNYFPVAYREIKIDYAVIFPKMSLMFSGEEMKLRINKRAYEWNE